MIEWIWNERSPVKGGFSETLENFTQTRLPLPLAAKNAAKIAPSQAWILINAVNQIWDTFKSVSCNWCPTWTYDQSRYTENLATEILSKGTHNMGWVKIGHLVHVFLSALRKPQQSPSNSHELVKYWKLTGGDCNNDVEAKTMQILWTVLAKPGTVLTPRGPL